jgi:signal transduction histidine kinase
MSDASARTGALGRQFALVVCATVATVGIVGFVAGRSILAQVAALADDRPVLESLAIGRQALIDLHHERRGKAEAQVAACRTHATLDGCIPDVKVQVEPALAVDSARPLPYWESERELIAEGPGGRPTRVVFDWPELKPRYEAFTDIIGTREHVASLLPTLTDSFLVVFAAALVGAGLLGLGVTWLLSRRLAGRVGALIAYTRRIGTGELLPAPAETRGGDELGLLADALHRMAKDLDETRQRLVLSEKMQSWQNVARKVAHEIKNPLTPISLVAAELQKRAAQMPDAASRGLLTEAGRVLHEETQSLDRMVREFSAFARLPDPELAAGDLLELVRDFVSRNQAATGPELVVVASRERFPVIMDRGMLTQILHNLVNNARLAKAPARVSIRFELDLADGTCALHVRDDGPGVPATLRATLFDAYVTSRSTGDGEKGMGLGLTISRKIASDHGGALVLATTGPEGTCFRLTLPAAEKWQETPPDLESSARLRAGQ